MTETIAQEASKIMGVRVEPHHFREIISRIDRSGGFSRRHMMEFIIMLCDHIERLEEHGATDKAQSNPNGTI